MTIQIWGHRGAGATDGAFAGQRQDGVSRYPENTLASFADAFAKGASAIETDAIRSADGRLFLTHSTRYQDHVAPNAVRADKPFIDQLQAHEVFNLMVGHRASGLPKLLGGSGPRFIPTLEDAFDLLSRVPGRGTVLNLELKDCQGTDFPRRTNPPIASTVVQSIHASAFPMARIRFSSFSADMLAELSAVAPRAKLAQLTDIGPEADGDVGLPIFKAPGSAELYLPFTAEVVRESKRRLPGLAAMHPEIRTLNEPALEVCKELGLQIATWGWREQTPAVAGTFQSAAARAVRLCNELEIPLQLITDYPAEMRQLVQEMGHGVNQPRQFRENKTFV